MVSSVDCSEGELFSVAVTTRTDDVVMSSDRDRKAPSESPPSLTAEACMDLRGTPCPVNFVRTKLRLEQMQPGKLLEVWLDAGEPVEQVPDSLTMAGHVVEQLEERNGFYSLIVRRSAEA